MPRTERHDEREREITRFSQPTSLIATIDDEGVGGIIIQIAHNRSERAQLANVDSTIYVNSTSLPAHAIRMAEQDTSVRRRSRDLLEALSDVPESQRTWVRDLCIAKCTCASACTVLP